MKKIKFSSWPEFSHKEVKVVSKVLYSNKLNYWTGDKVKIFEKEFASFIGTKYSIALSNGSLALELAIKALELKEGDEIIVTPRSFVASVYAVINNNLKPVFADINLNSQNIDINSIKKVFSRKSKAIICVHLAGWPCDMDPIMEFAKKKKLYVIEDCAQAHGAKYKGKHVGSIGHIACWSFCNDKIISTGGEGGMITTNIKKFWLKMWSYKDHGKNLSKIKQRSKNNYKFKWVHDFFGTNMRMTEIQASIGSLHLKSLVKWNAIRRRNVHMIWNTARKIGCFDTPEVKCNSCTGNCNISNGCLHAAYKCYLFFNKGIRQRDKLISILNFNGVPCSSGSCPEIYLEKSFEKKNFKPKNYLPIARELGEKSLMLQCHHTLKKKEIKLMCNILKSSVQQLNKNF
jgi:dTDP-4-amino-4,6-dideoxygalactose transaminase